MFSSRQPRWDSEVLVELWPASSEIRESEKGNAYLGTLTEFHESFEKLSDDLTNDSVPWRKYTDNYHEMGDPGENRSDPPTIIQIVLAISPAAVAAYKLLQLWVQLKNGRKIKIVADNLEIEATQLTKEEFLKLFEDVRELKREELQGNCTYQESKAKLKKYLDGTNIDWRELESAERHDDIIKLERLISEGLDEDPPNRKYSDLARSHEEVYVGEDRSSRSSET